MHGFSGRQAQQAHWREGQVALGTVSPEPTKDDEALAKQAAAELAFDAAQVAAVQD